eukprot:923417-Alexandrium_andersonii.AAC.1
MCIRDRSRAETDRAGGGRGWAGEWLCQRQEGASEGAGCVCGWRKLRNGKLVLERSPHERRGKLAKSQRA